jgi:hypothetical protein
MWPRLGQVTMQHRLDDEAAVQADEMYRLQEAVRAREVDDAEMRRREKELWYDD